jgi:macrodomain Ter protein organizer (MatP/YcbG family)
MTKTRTNRLSDAQVEALNELFKRLGIRGQRDRHLNAGMRYLADQAIDDMDELVHTMLDAFPGVTNESLEFDRQVKNMVKDTGHTIEYCKKMIALEQLQEKE